MLEYLSYFSVALADVNNLAVQYINSTIIMQINSGIYHTLIVVNILAV